MTALVSVVVPIYNVERYLTECLESLAHQTHRDLEVVMVDDGATDSSAGIAQAFADRDSRFRLVRQANGGLGHARNTGARHASGEYLAFVDSDDVVVRNAYELLVTSLEDTGSDFASGNYHRLTPTGTWQSAMVAGAFMATRLRTHVTRHPALLNDRTAWNKLFRRSFWDEHGFQWPEGVLYEDIPVTLPAHVLAQSVDVLRQPIYLWRARVGDSSSITQRRTEPRAIRDRTRAVDGVSRFLAEKGLRDLKKEYDRSVAEQDLRYFLTQLTAADDDFRTLFLDLVNDYFDRADEDVFDSLPAIRRLQWHLVRRRLMPELLEVLRFEESDEIDWTPVVRKGRRFWGDYPFRGDPRLRIPDDVYRLDRDEIPLRAAIEDVFWRDDTLTLVGWAHIAFQDLSREGSARIRLTLEESGHPESVVAMDVRVIRRPDVTSSLDGVTNYDWCGFEATVPVSALRHRGRYRDGHWRLRLEVRSNGILRRRWLARTEPGRARRPTVRLVDGARVIPTSERGDFAVQVSARAAEVTDLRLEGTVLEMSGVLHGRGLDPAAAGLRVARADGTAVVHYPAATAGAATDDGQPFVVRVATEDLLSQTADSDLAVAVEDHGDGAEWSLELEPTGEGTRVPLVAASGLAQPRFTAGPVEVAVRTSRTGRLRILERHFRPEVDSACWSTDGALELEAAYHEPTGRAVALVLRASDRDDEYVVPADREGDRLRVRLEPAAMPTVAGPLPLPEGQWDLYLRSGQDGSHSVRVKVDHGTLESLPSGHAEGARQRTLVDVEFDSLALVCGPDLPPQHAGRAGRRRLMRQHYPAELRESLLDQVLVDGYASGQYGGDARVVTEELLRRRPGLPVLWSVVDGQAVLPDGVRPVARHGPEWFEALARSRYVVASGLRDVGDLEKREEQRVLQTWHGVPVRPVALHDQRGQARAGSGWAERIRREAAQWDVLLASSAAEADLLRDAFGFSGQVAETGLPRHDLLVTGADPVRTQVRTRLGISAEARVVLYAPSSREDLPYDAGHGLVRFRFELDLDPEVARSALGADGVLLVRPHPASVDTVPWADGATVVDVSHWPDACELLLAADVVVTDASSMLVDAVVAGRPVRRWFVDGAAAGRPGQAGSLYPDLDPVAPLVDGDAATMVRAAVELSRGGDRDALDAEDLAAWKKLWCPLVDGRAARRAVDALLVD